MHRGVKMYRTRKVPFEYKNKQDFQEKLVEWIGDVLYDHLPEHEYEVRDEQIFTAFQIADAVGNPKAHLAEAGLGTGKTFAYLLSAIPFARMSKKPVVIASATTALQEQLAGETGDIKKLGDVLQLSIDARMAKDPNQYLCDVRAEENRDRLGENAEMINQWIQTTKVGERSEIPTITDKEWRLLKWDESMNCDTCQERGYCRMVKAREHYRQTQDLLIVDHATFFQDLWTREERELTGRTTILPEYSAVIFDEGHKVLLPSMVQAGQYVNREEMAMMIESLEELQGVREELLYKTELVRKGAYLFFKNLKPCIEVVAGEQRFNVKKTPELVKAATTFYKTLDQLLLELQIEQGLYSEALTPTQAQACEIQIERAMWALKSYAMDTTHAMLSWVERKDASFWVVPRNIGDRLDKYLFKKGIPAIFTSATLSHEGDFEYFRRLLGLKLPTYSTIGSPFDLARQVKVYLPEQEKRLAVLVKLLRENNGRALVLTSLPTEMKRIRQALKDQVFPFEMLWEDQGDRGYLVRKFREDENSVLIGSPFWEGIDVPGDALTLVVVWDLPLHIQDPLIEAQRKDAQLEGRDPVTTVDYKEMALRLKQGCGRLIRTEKDHGTIVILDKVLGTPYESYVRGALPKDAPVYEREIPTLSEV